MNNTQVKQDRNTAAYFFGFGNFKNLLFLGSQKERFLLFWGAEFMLGLSPSVLVN